MIVAATPTIIFPIIFFSYDPSALGGFPIAVSILLLTDQLLAFTVPNTLKALVAKSESPPISFWLIIRTPMSMFLRTQEPPLVYIFDRVSFPILPSVLETGASIQILS